MHKCEKVEKRNPQDFVNKTRHNSLYFIFGVFSFPVVFFPQLMCKNPCKT